MLSIKTILAATDFSPMSDHAFQFAGALARDYGARLIVLHVIQPPVPVYGETAVFMEEPDRNCFREALEALRVPGVEVEYRLMEGEPSAPSRLNFRVEPLQFDPCFVDRELPIDGSLLLVDTG